MPGITGGISATDFFATANTGVEVQFDEMFRDFVKGDHLLYTDAAGGFNQTTLEINVVGTNPELRKWVGSREEHSYRGYKLTATMETYESTLAIPEDDYDRQGQEAVRRRVDGFLPSCQSDISRIAHNFLLSNPDCYDGVSLYSASHPHGPGGANQVNITNADVNLSSIWTALSTMADLRDEHGRVLGVSGDTIICGNLTWPRVMEAVQAEMRGRAIDYTGKETATDAFAVSTIPNVYQGLVRVVLDPYITDYTAYIIDTKRQSKPIILREIEGGVDLTALIRKEDPNVFYDRTYKWGLKWKSIFCGGSWQVIHKINGTA